MSEADRRGSRRESGDGGGGKTRSLSGDDQDTVRGLEGFVGRAVLVHMDSEVKPGFRISVRQSAKGHSC